MGSFKLTKKRDMFSFGIFQFGTEPGYFSICAQASHNAGLANFVYLILSQIE